MCGPELLDLDPAGLSGQALSNHVVALARLRGQVEAALLGAVGEWDANTGWAADAFLNGATWLVHHGSINRTEARNLISDARALRHHPVTAAAAATIGIARARVLARVANGRTEGTYHRDENLLIEQARTLTVDQTATMARFWQHRADTGGPTEETDPVVDHEQRTRERRRVHLSQTFEGTWRLDGELDIEAGAVLSNALGAVSDELYRSEIGSRDGQGSVTASQRRADALVELARRAMAADPERSVIPKPLIMAIVDLNTLEGRAGRTCELDGAGTITPDAARRLACDAGICRVIIDGSSNVLDLGTTTPTPSAAQRRALRLRDNGCVAPGCDRPPGWCEAHHIQHRQHGGPTNLDNLCLLCPRHHHLHHAGRLGIARAPNGTLTFTRADGTTINSEPQAA